MRPPLSACVVQNLQINDQCLRHLPTSCLHSVLLSPLVTRPLVLLAELIGGTSGSEFTHVIMTFDDLAPHLIEVTKCKAAATHRL